MNKLHVTKDVKLDSRESLKNYDINKVNIQENKKKNMIYLIDDVLIMDC